MEEKKKKTTKKVFSIVGEVLLWALALFCVSISLVNVIDSHTNYSCSYFGLRTNVIVSQSMENKHPENTYLDEFDSSRISKYDVIIAKEVSYEEIEIYDVVLHVESGNLICHRVIDKYTSDGVEYLVTRGDANNVNDTPFSYSLFKGKVINVIPKVGKVVLFLQSGYFLLAIFLSMFLISTILFTLSYLRDRKQKKLEVNNSKDVVLDIKDENNANNSENADDVDTNNKDENIIENNDDSNNKKE